MTEKRLNTATVHDPAKDRACPKLNCLRLNRSRTFGCHSIITNLHCHIREWINKYLQNSPLKTVCQIRDHCTVPRDKGCDRPAGWTSLSQRITVYRLQRLTMQWCSWIRGLLRHLDLITCHMASRNASGRLFHVVSARSPANPHLTSVTSLRLCGNEVNLIRGSCRADV